MVAFDARKAAAHSPDNPSSTVSLFSCIRGYESGAIGFRGVGLYRGTSLIRKRLPAGKSYASP
jgi:hypothetical protein